LQQTGVREERVAMELRAAPDRAGAVAVSAVERQILLEEPAIMEAVEMAAQVAQTQDLPVVLEEQAQAQAAINMAGAVQEAVIALADQAHAVEF